jgi:hypothetical protein
MAVPSWPAKFSRAQVDVDHPIEVLLGATDEGALIHALPVQARGLKPQARLEALRSFNPLAGIAVLETSSWPQHSPQPTTRS